MFVVGVSHYDSLPQRAQDPVSDETFGLRQLESAATSAVEFARWMRDEYRQPEAPLKEIWMLLSPSARERRKLADDEKEAPPATRDEVRAALDHWRAACEADRDGIAVFYASGHGIVLGPHEGGIVLLEDFAADPNRRMERTLSMVDARAGLSGPEAAKRQYWFLDACQPLPEQRGGIDLQSAGVPGWDRYLHEQTDVSAVYMSATTGTNAYGDPGHGTIFSKALAECLSLRAVGLGDPDGWVVTDTALGRRLRERVAELARERQGDQTAAFGGRPGEIPFHVLDEPPQLDVTFAVAPPNAGDFAFGTLTPGAGSAVFERQPLRAPLTRKVAAGQYIVKVAIDPATDPFLDTELPCIVAPNRSDRIEVAVVR